MKLDLNCDLGEGEPPARTRALMRQVTSVNVACGGHAGDAATMERCVLLAKELGVRVGAHPGVAGSFGRGEFRLSPGQLQTLLLHQVGALHRLAEVHRVRLHHVKLHGSLYHAVEQDAALGRCYVETAARWFRGLPIYALAGGRVVALGQKLGVPVWAEAFADRAYRDDGTLVSRGEPGAILTDPKLVAARIRSLRDHGCWTSVSGAPLKLKPRTLCVHGDTPHALALARAARRTLAQKMSPGQSAAGFQPAEAAPPKVVMGIPESSRRFRKATDGLGEANPWSF